jgi:AcrR family transcriptional regulator
MSREQRYRQLLDVSWLLVREEGTEALTLGRLAEEAGVTKPVVYDHFSSRPALLAALYGDFDDRQTKILEKALLISEPTLQKIATIIASSYVDCVLTQGREIPGVIAALTSSPELEKIKLEYEMIFMAKCRSALSPYTKGNAITVPSLRAMLGAAEALSHAAANGEITPSQAENELFEIIIAMVERSGATSQC